MARNSKSLSRASKESLRISSRTSSSPSSKIGNSHNRLMPQTPTFNASSRSRVETRLREIQRAIALKFFWPSSSAPRSAAKQTVMPAVSRRSARSSILMPFNAPQTDLSRGAGALRFAVMMSASCSWNCRYCTALLGRAEAAQASARVLAVSYALGTEIEVTIHAENATPLRRRNWLDFINYLNSLCRWRFPDRMGAWVSPYCGRTKGKQP